MNTHIVKATLGAAAANAVLLPGRPGTAVPVIDWITGYIQLHGTTPVNTNIILYDGTTELAVISPNYNKTLQASEFYTFNLSFPQGLKVVTSTGLAPTTANIGLIGTVTTGIHSVYVGYHFV